MSESSKDYKNQKIDMRISMIARDFALLRNSIRKVDRYGNDLLLDNPDDVEEAGLLKSVKIENKDILNQSAKAIKKLENIQYLLRKFAKNI